MDEGLFFKLNIASALKAYVQRVLRGVETNSNDSY
jgi:hypothetical protein